jgi:hypothetical protein
MEELSYSKLQNNIIIQKGAGIFDIITGSSSIISSIPIIFAILATCTLSSYLCSNSNKIFKKSTEEYFIYLWIGLLLFGTILSYLQVNNYFLMLPPFIGPGIYITLIIILIMSCCYSM